MQCPAVLGRFPYRSLVYFCSCFRRWRLLVWLLWLRHNHIPAPVGAAALVLGEVGAPQALHWGPGRALAGAGVPRCPLSLPCCWVPPAFIKIKGAPICHPVPVCSRAVTGTCSPPALPARDAAALTRFAGQLHRRSCSRAVTAAN